MEEDWLIVPEWQDQIWLVVSHKGTMYIGKIHK